MNTELISRICIGNSSVFGANTLDDYDKFISDANIEDIDIKINVGKNILRNSDDDSLVKKLAGLIIERKNWSEYIKNILLDAQPTHSVLNLVSTVIKKKIPKHPLADVTDYSFGEMVYDAINIDGKINLRPYNMNDISFTKALLINQEDIFGSWAICNVINPSAESLILIVEQSENFVTSKYIMPPLIAFSQA
jgi:hypothetical protein